MFTFLSYLWFTMVNKVWFIWLFVRYVSKQTSLFSSQLHHWRWTRFEKKKEISNSFRVIEDSPCFSWHRKSIKAFIPRCCFPTCQLSRFCRESHDVLSFLKISWQGSQSDFWEKSFWNEKIKLFNKNGIFILRWMLVPYSVKLMKKNSINYSLTTFLYRAVIFAFVQYNLSLFSASVRHFWKRSRPWEWGWCLVSWMEKGFDQEKAWISLLFVECPDIFSWVSRFSFTRGW